MNVIDEFFAAPTWDAAIPRLVPRRAELAGSEALAAFQKLADDVGHSAAARQVLAFYADFLRMNVRGDLPRIKAFFERHPPKLTRSDLLGLARVDDAASARVFKSEAPQAWLALLVSQLIQGDAFWRLLLASAELAGSAPATDAPAHAGTTVVVAHEGCRRRVCTVLPLPDGGFAVAVPHHKARTGSLMKMPLLRQTGSVDVHVAATVPFHASERVQLSYHPDGFVEFSGEGESRIVSGRDDRTGEPKGLGLVSRPLESPIQSGPSVACSVWGLADFDEWTGGRAERAVVFEEADFYEEPDDGQSRAVTPGYSVSMFVFPPRFVEAAVGDFGTAATLKMLLPMNIHHRKTPFRVKLVRVGPQCCLGVIALRQAFGFPRSGFQLSGPGDGEHSMMAMYPAMPLRDRGRSLDAPTRSG